MSETKKGRGCFFYGCAFTLGFGALFVAAIVGIYFYGSHALAPYGDKFLTLVDSGDFTGAYAMLGEGWKKQATLQEFTDFETSVKSALGPCNTKSVTGVSINSVNGSTTAKLVYSAQFAKGPATLTFTLIQEGGDWKIQGLQYNSDLLKNGLPPPAKPPAESPEDKSKF